MNFRKWKWVLFVPAAMLLGFVAATAQHTVKTTAAGSPAADHNEKADIERITVDELKAMMAENEPVTVIDVRGNDYDSSDAKIKGALRIVPGELNARLKDVPRDKPIVTYCSCATDGGALVAAKLLRDNGFKSARALKGGWPAWKEAGGATEPKK